MNTAARSARSLQACERQRAPYATLALPTGGRPQQRVAVQKALQAVIAACTGRNTN